MITTEDKKEIPMEIYLLMRVKHPNIVNVLDVYENEKFYQLIMEKHGSGMDLVSYALLPCTNVQQLHQFFLNSV